MHFTLMFYENPEDFGAARAPVNAIEVRENLPPMK